MRTGDSAWNLGGMPIYLVRWPGPVASLVRAEDDAELLMILDEDGSTAGAEWAVYEGPIAIDFRLNADIEVHEPVKGARQRARVGDVSHLRESPFVLAFPAAEAASEMTQAILDTAFPTIASVLADAQGDEPPDPAKVTEALAVELHHFLAPAPEPDVVPYPAPEAADRPQRQRGKLIPLMPRRDRDPD